MSAQDDGAGAFGDPEITIKDDEGVVDAKIKEHILNLRKQIDDYERVLYIEGGAGQQGGIPAWRADQYWGITIRQYLRGIKRLWNSDEKENQIKNVHQYWTKKPIGKDDIIPPDKDGYRFSLCAREKYTDKQLKRLLNLPPGADVPRPKRVKFKGLNSILNRDKIDASWAVTVDQSGPPSNHEVLYLETVQPVPKHILEEAVEVADNFLQQAGIGFETKVPDYMGEGGPGL